MGLRFVKKIVRSRPVCDSTAITVNMPVEETKREENKENPVTEKVKTKNKKEKKDNKMDTLEQIEAAEELVKELQPEVKVVKKERGLIERTESSKIILTEDNRQVLND